MAEQSLRFENVKLANATHENEPRPARRNSNPNEQTFAIPVDTALLTRNEEVSKLFASAVTPKKKIEHNPIKFENPYDQAYWELLAKFGRPVKKYVLDPIGKGLRYALPLPEWWFTRHDQIKKWVDRLTKMPLFVKLLLVPALVGIAIAAIPVPGPWSAMINSVAAAIVFGMWGAEWATRFSMTFFVQPMVWVLKNTYNAVSWTVNSLLSPLNLIQGKFAKGPKYSPLVNMKGVHN